ncbi:MAG: hypothetical protein V1858_02990 [Candidatus Gottesmanbacteria bacterium]
MKRAILLNLFLFVFVLKPVFALENNKFGIHIIQPEDLPRAAELVNSNSGDWGYVTIVIADNDRNKDKWQSFFDDCRQKHLIPLVRIATHLENDIWSKPEENQISEWAKFLDSLNWPVKTQYISIYNEPNHNKEWGGKSDPVEYAKILDKALTIFKQKNSNFYILNAGFDQAAGNSPTTIDEEWYIAQMEKEVPGIFSRLDGWVSHSYPNHGFIGKPWETGRASVAGYQWELSILKSQFGVTKNLPIFITETGWPHRLDNRVKGIGYSYYDEKLTAEYIKQAFENVWLADDQVIAVTPFILNYPAYPFENFSWLDSSGQPLSQYQEIKSIKKNIGQPEQKQSFALIKSPFPPIVTTNLVFNGKVILKNTGQSIWGEKPFILKAFAPGLKLSDLILPSGQLVKPGQRAELDFTLETVNVGGDYVAGWQGLTPYEIKVFGIWGLTASPNTPLNNILENIFGFWFNL